MSFLKGFFSMFDWMFPKTLEEQFEFDEQMNVAKRVMTEERKVLQRISEDNHRDVYLHSPTLKELLRESEDLCYRLKVPYDPYKIKVTTDFGTKVVVFYDGETE